MACHRTPSSMDPQFRNTTIPVIDTKPHSLFSKRGKQFKGILFEKYEVFNLNSYQQRY